MTPAERTKAAMEVLKALTDTIRECPDGAPLGPMYLAFMERGMSLDTFQNIIAMMKHAGVIEVRNNCAFWVAGRVQ